MRIINTDVKIENKNNPLIVEINRRKSFRSTSRVTYSKKIMETRALTKFLVLLTVSFTINQSSP
jgi:hypothetical protein